MNIYGGKSNCFSERPREGVESIGMDFFWSVFPAIISKNKQKTFFTTPLGYAELCNYITKSSKYNVI